jgi:hypothetical protein
MDFTKIPAMKSFFIKDGFYDLLFEVENAAIIGLDAVMVEAHGHDDDNDNGNGNIGDQPNLGDQQNLPVGDNEITNTPAAGLGSAGAAATSNAPNATTIVPGLIFSPALRRSFEDSKKRFMEDLLKAKELGSGSELVSCLGGGNDLLLSQPQLQKDRLLLTNWWSQSR